MPSVPESPDVALSVYAHDRHGLERTDEAWLARTWGEADTRVLPISGNRMLVRDGLPAYLLVPDLPEAAAAPEAVRVLLGEHDGAAYFAALFDPSGVAGSAEEWQGLRPVLEGVLTGDLAALTFHAMGMAEWHWSTRHCVRCGQPLSATHAGHVLSCASPSGCGRPQFPRTDPRRHHAGHRR